MSFIPCVDVEKKPFDILEKRFYVFRRCKPYLRRTFKDLKERVEK